MLRVLFLAAGQELLLMTSKADAGMYGYLEKTGIIESLVMQEYKSFIGRSPPQMVCSIFSNLLCAIPPNYWSSI